MALVTLKTFSKQIGANQNTIMTWCNNKLDELERPKDVRFTHKMIHFVIIDGRRFVDTAKTKLPKQLYTDLFKDKAGRR